MDEESVLLHEPDLMLAILRAAQQGPADLDDAMARLLANLAAAHEPPPAEQGELQARLHEAASLLFGAGAIAPAGENGFRLTQRGSRLLAEYPDGVDQSVLHEFPEFRAFVAASARTEEKDDPRLSAFEAGMRAFAEGRELSDNPFASDRPDHLGWECGWSEARDAARPD